MIDPKELRIGNFVMASNTPVEVHTIMGNGLQYIHKGNKYGAVMISQFKPIELTEEWLVKFGFKWRKGTHRWVIGKLKAPGYRYDVELIPIAKGFQLDGRIIISYVHELQNIYYWNSGKKELEIKL